VLIYNVLIYFVNIFSVNWLAIFNIFSHPFDVVLYFYSLMLWLYFVMSINVVIDCWNYGTIENATIQARSNARYSSLSIHRSLARWLTAGRCVCVRFTYEIAPVFTLIEDVILTKMRQLIGWTDGHGDGIFAPGTRPVTVWPRPVTLTFDLST